MRTSERRDLDEVVEECRELDSRTELSEQGKKLHSDLEGVHDVLLERHSSCTTNSWLTESFLDYSEELVREIVEIARTLLGAHGTRLMLRVARCVAQDTSTPVGISREFDLKGFDKSL